MVLRQDKAQPTIYGMRASADGVLFEFGPSRRQDLAWRSKFRQWQPQLRLLFVTEIALWKYRARLLQLNEPSMTNWRERWKPSQIESKDGHRK